MRSIGKVRIRQLRRIVAEEYSAANSWETSSQITRDQIEDRIPAEWYETWEGAWSEIQREIGDAINDARRVARTRAY